MEDDVRIHRGEVDRAGAQCYSARAGVGDPSVPCPGGAAKTSHRASVSSAGEDTLGAPGSQSIACSKVLRIDESRETIVPTVDQVLCQR